MSKISPTIADDAQSDAQDNNLDQNGSRSNESDAQDDVDVVKMSERPAGVRLVYAFVENSGRLDQIMANLQSLFLGRYINPFAILHKLKISAVCRYISESTYYIISYLYIPNCLPTYLLKIIFPRYFIFIFSSWKFRRRIFVEFCVCLLAAAPWIPSHQSATNTINR